MKRVETHQIINRNNDTVFNGINRESFCTNTVTSTRGRTSALDFIELNSSTTTATSSKKAHGHSPEAWSYNTDEFQDIKNDYWLNETARQKRRTKITTTTKSEYKNHFISDVTNSTYIENLHKNNVTLNHPINCFTIIKKHFVNSDTSTDHENCSNVELAQQMGDGLVDHDKTEKYEDVDTYHLDDLQDKTRTIWIYSFKNKHLLAENDCNLINTSFDTDSSICSSEKVFEETDDHLSKNTRRISSPIPPIYVPRLDLSAGQTLSTVTELSDEQNKHYSHLETERSIKNILKQKPINNWVVNDNKDANKLEIDQKESSGNAVEWLALSPRVEIRKYNINLETEREVLKSFDIESNLTNKQKSKYNKKLTDYVAVKKQTDNKFYCRNKKTDQNEITRPTSNYNKQISCTDLITDEIIPTEPEINENNTDEVKHYITLRIPKIRINKKRPSHGNKVSAPIEKLDTNNWIIEDSEIKPSIYECELEPCGDVINGHIRNISINDRLWSRNAKLLMKPAHWDEYKPIAETPMSISVSYDSGLERKPWFSILIKCFRCFKCYK